MRGIDINLASRPFRNQLLPALLLGVLGLAALLSTVANIYYYSTRARDAEAFAARIQQVEEELSALDVEGRGHARSLEMENIPALNEQVAVANGLLQRRGFSWTQLFNTLEKVQPYHVQLETVQPNPAGDVILLSVTGEAKKHDDALEYIDNLEASPHFARVYPQNETLTSGGTVRFLLRMVYLPDADQPAGEEG